MEATDQLSLIAELGTGFAGFIAIFLIFARSEGRFSPADSLRIRVIISASFVAIFMALLPLLLALSELGISDVWRVSSLVFLGIGVSMNVATGRTQLSLAPEERAEVGLANNVFTWTLACLIPILLAVNAVGALGGPSALLYLTALALVLGLATSNFVAIALQRLL